MISSKTLRLVFTAALLIGFSSLVHAQSAQTWVSGVGNDANPCTRTAPCRTFAGALARTAVSGEISALDPGDFGTVSISQSVTISGTGTLASVTVSAANGIDLNLGPTDVVILRDISINGLGTANTGIRYNSGGTLMVDHCSIYGFIRGIDARLNGNGNLKVLDCVIERMRDDGLHLTTLAGELLLTVDNTRIMNCAGDGIEALSNVRGAISRCRVTHNPISGVKTSGTNSLLNLDDVFVSYGSIGLQASAGSSLRVSDCTIAQNATGLSLNGGTINSFQGNALMGNPTPGAFSTTTPKL